MAGLIPKYGPLPGNLRSNGVVIPQVKGGARPFAPGEILENPDGSWSNEISTTVGDPGLNSGRPTNIPTLWIIGGKPVRLTDDQAARAAAESGLNFQSYNTFDEADAAAMQREKAWQGISPDKAGAVQPLWSVPK